MESFMVLGITGNIASGKSTVAERFAECGAVLVSADQLAREVVNPGSPTLAALVEEFGEEILTAGGSLNREVMGQVVFADSEKRKKLESIVHPAIAHLADCRLADLRKAPEDVIVYEAPLLFEAGGEGRVDQVLVVTVDPAVQEERLVKRDGLSGTEARQRIEAQWPQAEKIRRADYVIDNSGSVQQTLAEVDTLYHYLVDSRD
jgi:dephospho-CoA kinase